jgi:hypothetical protein
MSIQTDAFLCGWRVQSEICLPELLPWEDDGAAVDIRIRLGDVPPLRKIVASTRRLTVDDTGVCRLEIPCVATFSVRDGREIVIDPLASPDPFEVRNYLFGTGLGLICHQRGVFPLHGSCLQLGEGAVIFSGHSGAGKSTLAAALAHRGHTLLADDVCVLKETARGWVVLPAFPRVKLMPAALQAIFGAEAEKAGLSLQGKHHFHFEPVRSFAKTPVPLDTIYFLVKTPHGEPDSIVDVSGLKRLALLESQIFRPKAAAALGRRESLFRSAAGIAAIVPIRELRRNFDLKRIGATLAMVEGDRRIPPVDNPGTVDRTPCRY